MKKLIIGMALAGVMAGGAVTGTVFADPATNPSAADCHGLIASSEAHEHGSVAKAAAADGFDSVKELQQAIQAFCADD